MAGKNLTSASQLKSSVTVVVVVVVVVVAVVVVVGSGDIWLAWEIF